MAKTGVIGAGSWGTALALVLHQNGHEVTLWSHSEASVKSLLKERELPGKLPGVKIPEEIQITGDLEQAIRGMDMLVLAVPSAASAVQPGIWPPSWRTDSLSYAYPRVSRKVP